MSDTEKLEEALRLIRSTDAWQKTEEDPDYTLHQAEWMLSRHLNGERWI